jgi:two-component system response regulator NreC
MGQLGVNVPVVLVDDHPMMLLAMREVFASREPPLEVVGEATTAREAIAVCEKSQPDVVVMDLMLPGPNGISAMREIRRARKGCRIVVYTGLNEPSFAFHALAAGADGYVLKTDSPEHLLAAIDKVKAGGRYLSPAVEERLDAAGRERFSGLETLSTREREIFDLLVKGHSNVELAQYLFISVKTVETHRSRINKKLGVHSTAQLIRFAALNGLFAD